jgi:hypothetical protein
MQYRARETFLWRGRIYEQGTVANGTELVVERNRVLFIPIETPAVEQATAAPGERRAVRIPRKKES